MDDRQAPTPLSHIETRILMLASQGLTSREVGESLGYSRRYIEHMLVEIHEKLDARNTVHAVVIALQEGLITLDEL